MGKLYMDNASGTPVHPKVVEAMVPFLKEGFGNPSNLHQFGRVTSEAIQLCRKISIVNKLKSPVQSQPA